VPVELGILTNRPVIAAARVLEKITYQAAKHVIALSPGMAAGVKAVSPKAPVTIIPNASDFDIFRSARLDRESVRDELGWKSDEVVIVYAGSFGKTYDVPWLVELAAELRGISPRYRVMICGKGADTQRMIDRAQELHLDTASLLPGPMPKNVIARILPSADFAVSTMIDAPPLEVNSLNKVFDALAAATPVLFNHNGWLPDLLERCGAGIKLSRDPREAAHQLDRRLTEGFDRDAAATAAFELGKKKFDREDLFADFLGVLESVKSLQNRKVFSGRTLAK